MERRDDRARASGARRRPGQLRRLVAALAHAGFRDVRNDFGSFGEWSRDPDCPVEAAGTDSPRPLD
jgi:hypothetical protein